MNIRNRSIRINNNSSINNNAFNFWGLNISINFNNRNLNRQISK